MRPLPWYATQHYTAQGRVACSAGCMQPVGGKAPKCPCPCHARIPSLPRN